MKIIAAITSGLFAFVSFASLSYGECKCPDKYTAKHKKQVEAAKDEKACVKLNKECKWEAAAAAAAPAAAAPAPAAEPAPAK